MKAHATFLPVIIAFVQLFDLAIHATTDQLEPLRVASNAVILLWLVLMAFGIIRGYARQTGIASVSGYLLLNAIFLAQAGFTNPAQGGAVRWMLILLVALTLSLAVWLIYRLGATSEREKGAGRKTSR